MKKRLSHRGLPMDANGLDAEDRRQARERQERLARNIAAGNNPKTGRPPGQNKIEWQRKRRAELRGQKLEHPGFTVHQPVSGELDINALIQRRVEEFERKREAADGRDLIHIDLHQEGPIGLWVAGDPHLDDPHCDFPQLLKDVDTVLRTPGAYAACVGDFVNNWHNAGRLAKLHADQNTTAKEAWALVEWFIGKLKGKWLWIVSGNHDAWAGNEDPLQWITSHARTLSEPSACRMAFNFPNGRQITCHARHSHPGHSLWNAGHGVGRQIQKGIRDHLVIGGHTHVSALNCHKDPETKQHCWGIQVASYKGAGDPYARDKGFQDGSLSPCCFIVINPDAEDEVGLIQVFWSAQVGADYLTDLRARWAAGKRRAG